MNLPRLPTRNGLKMKGSWEIISDSIPNPFFLLNFPSYWNGNEKIFLRGFFPFFRHHRKVGWRLGLQIVTVLVSLSFFMGLLYRPASLYHPQRRAILHLKNSRKKVGVSSSLVSSSNLILLYDIDLCNLQYCSGRYRGWIKSINNEACKRFQ